MSHRGSIMSAFGLQSVTATVRSDMQESAAAEPCLQFMLSLAVDDGPGIMHFEVVRGFRACTVLLLQHATR